MLIKLQGTFFCALVIMIIFTTTVIANPHHAFATPSIGIMIPLYSHHESNWPQVLQEKNAHPSVPIVVIINPNNGPDSSIDSNLISSVKQMQAAGIVVIGYDDTGYCGRSADDVESDAMSYYNWYKVNGIFFDDMANGSGCESYYTDLTNYVHSHGMPLTVGNPGTRTLSSYVGSVDNLVIYEKTGLPTLSTLLSNTFNGENPASNFSIMALGVRLPSVSYITSNLSHVGYIYITDARGSNPYDVLPSYFSTEVADLDTDSGTTATIPSAPSGLTSSASSSSQINLSWTAPSNNGGSTIAGYEIDRPTNGSSTWSVLIGNTASTDTTYSDTGLVANTTYTYRISAINAIGTSSPSNTTSATTQSRSAGGGSTSGTIVLNNVQYTSGTVSSSNQLTLSNFTVGTGNSNLLVVGVSANNNTVTSITFGGMPLKMRTMSFYNNDAEFWYLKKPNGTGDIVVTMAGPTQAVAGAYSFSGVNQANPIATTAKNHNTSVGSPHISITTKYDDDLVLDLPSIWGGMTLSSPTWTQQWNVNVPNEITGASSSTTVPSATTVTCKWAASSKDLWDDVAIEINAAR